MVAPLLPPVLEAVEQKNQLQMLQYGVLNGYVMRLLF